MDYNGTNENFHAQLVEEIGNIAGINNVDESFENPNNYGDIVSHISFKFNVVDKWNYSSGRIVFDYKSKRLFIPDLGYRVLKELNKSDIIKHIKSYYKLK